MCVHTQGFFIEINNHSAYHDHVVLAFFLFTTARDCHVSSSCAPLININMGFLNSRLRQHEPYCPRKQIESLQPVRDDTSCKISARCNLIQA